jgi:hypothetical protein
MKKIILTSLITVLTFISYAQEGGDTTALNCKKFHTGTFQIIGKGKHVVITRNETTQTETNTRTGEESVYTIIWVSECVFELRPTTDKDKEFFDGKPFIGEIIALDDKTYTCIAGLAGEKTTVSDKIRKLE